MSQINVTINAKGVITGINQVEQGFARVTSSAGKTQQEVQKALKFDATASIKGLGGLSDRINNIGKAASTLQNVLAGGFIGSAILGAIKSAVAASVELENALVGLRSVATKTGTDLVSIESAARGLASDGLIPLSDVTAGLKNLLSAGIGAPEAIKVLRTLKDSSAFNRQGFLTMGEAVRGATEGIKNQNSILIDNAGITKNVSIFYREYAASIGKTAGNLSEMEKRQAIVNGIIREGAVFSGDAAKIQNTFSGATSKLATAIFNLSAKLGDLVTKNRGAVFFLNGLSSGLNLFAGALADDTTIQKLTKLKAELRDFDEVVKQVNPGGISDANAKSRRFKVYEIELIEREISRGKELAKVNKERYDATAKAQVDAEESGKAQAATAKAQVSALKKLRAEYAVIGQTALQSLELERDKKLKIAKNDSALRLQIEAKFQRDKTKLEDSEERKRLALAARRTKLEKQIRGAVAAGASNPFGSVQKPAALQNPKTEEDKAKSQRFDTNVAIGRGVGIAGDVVQGAAGAKNLVSGLAKGGLDLISPGLGQAAGPLIDGLLAGPDAVRKMVKEFAKALPDLITAFIEAIPVFIEELANQIPTIITRIAEKAPEIINALIKGLPKAGIALATMMPKVAFTFITELVKNIPRVITEMVNQISRALSGGILGGKKGGGGGGIKGALTTGPTKSGAANLALNVATFGASGIASKYLGLKFAKGGQVPEGYPNDTLPARLSSGENIIDRTLNNKLEKFLNEGDALTNNLLLKIHDLLSQEQVINVAAKINDKTFADLILNASRANQRLATK